ncbi:hypothetical protein [Streptomyces sp. NPDC002054]
MITIGSLRAEDRAAWEALARGYKAFYRTAVPASSSTRRHAAEAWRGC